MPGFNPNNHQNEGGPLHDHDGLRPGEHIKAPLHEHDGLRSGGQTRNPLHDAPKTEFPNESGTVAL